MKEREREPNLKWRFGIRFFAFIQHFDISREDLRTEDSEDKEKEKIDRGSENSPIHTCLGYISDVG